MLKIRLSTILMAAFAGVLASASLATADVVVESGDAGSTLGTAQNATGVASVTSITGNLSTFTDVDLYKIHVVSPSLLSITTVGTTTLDTALFLFSGSGAAIVTNDDDAGGLVFQSTIPSGSSYTASLLEGDYYIGISLSGNEPVNSSNQLLFATGLITDLRGAAAGVSPVTLADFNGSTSFPESGAYGITVAVPEPSTMALAGLALVAGGWKARSRRSKHEKPFG